MPISPHLAGILLALASMLVFAGVVLTIAKASKRLDTDAGALVATIANVPVGLLLLAGQLLLQGPLQPPTPMGLAAFAAAGFFGTYLGRWLFFKSVETMGPSRASGFQSASPLFTAVLGWLLLGETFGPWGLMGLLLGFVGLLAMGQRGKRTGAGAGTGTTASVGASRGILVMGMGSAAAYAMSHILRAAGLRDWHEALAGATVGAAAGLVALLLASRKQLPGIVARIRSHPEGFRLFCVVGVLQLAGQTLMILSLHYIPASFSALISMGSPLIVLPVSHFLLRTGEGLRPLTVVGIVLTLMGVGLLALN